MEKLILRNNQSPGDIVMLTAALRDLHQCYPEVFVTDVRTSCQELWENNPYLTPLSDDDPDAEILDCHYPLIHKSNQTPYHFIHGFIEFLNNHLDLKIRPTAFKGDIHLSDSEKCLVSQVEELTGKNIPFWLVAAGGKRDMSVKWWDIRRYQKVINHFHGRVQFVQIGGEGHFHPELKNAMDLRGKTSLRQLVRLVYHSEGVLCPVTGLMHLAAAIETRKDLPPNRPCVVVAGGREPSHWEAYPHHQFIHTIGMLPCCSTGGCWRSRTFPIGDRSEKDRPENLCVDVVGKLPRCMDMITAEEVIRRIEFYLEGQKIWHLRSEQQKEEAIPTLIQSKEQQANEDLSLNNAKAISEEFIRDLPPYPGGFVGRGIVICGGGIRYFVNAWVCINMLRWHGCSLPIQLWYLGEKELDERMKALLHHLGVTCVDATEIRKKHPARILNGWELKPYAILHSPFKEVLSLDADNIPVLNPEYLFHTPQFKQTGAIFWPDFGRLQPTRMIWSVCGVTYRDEPEVESGQIVVDKEKCWDALQLCMWYNEHSDFYYQYIHGDKETFHLAFRRVNKSYAMPDQPIHRLKCTMCQHDFEGNRIFQHRNLDKWNLFGKNHRIEGFLFEDECFGFLNELRTKWSTNDSKTIQGAEDLSEANESPAPEANAAKTGEHNSTTQFSRVKPKLSLRAPFDGYTGYGLHAQQIVKYFENSNYDIWVRPTKLEQRPRAPIRPEVFTRIDKGPVSDGWELLLHPPNATPTPELKTVYFTMWETTQLSPGDFQNLLAAEAVVVPCEWNASCFSAQGIKAPIFVCPLGIDPDTFKFQAMTKSSTVVFGAAGNSSISGRTRKGLDDAIRAFQLAFPTEKDVALEVKIRPGDEVENFYDSRIKIIKRHLSHEELADWYRGLTCFISGAKAEAWGLMQHQAMAVGRPVIASRFGGLREFFDGHVGYCVDYSLKPADERYEGLGMWAQPEMQSFVEQLRRVYENREEAQVVGERASVRAHCFTWHRSNQRLENVLKEIRMI